MSEAETIKALEEHNFKLKPYGISTFNKIVEHHLVPVEYTEKYLLFANEEDCLVVIVENFYPIHFCNYKVSNNRKRKSDNYTNKIIARELCEDYYSN